MGTPQAHLALRLSGVQVHSHSGALSLPKWGGRPWRSCSPAQLPHWQAALPWELMRACLAALSWSRVVHPKSSDTPLLLQEVHKERIALETQLEQLRPVTVLWLPTRLSRSRAVSSSPARRGVLCSWAGSLPRHEGGLALLALSSPHYAQFAFAGEEGTENKYLTMEYFWVGDALPSFLPLPSLMCKCSLSLKWITWEYFIYVKNSWFICVLAAPPALIIKRYSIPKFLLKLKTHPLRCASGCYWFL